MTPKIMDMEKHWQRVLDEQLGFLAQDVDASKASYVMMTGGKDARDTMLKALVQQAARN